jgi:hypothetical protein
MATAHLRPPQTKEPSLRKFKSMPFIWESQNYLLKLKSDTHFLHKSVIGRHFNFSNKSDPFLVYPSSKVVQRGKRVPKEIIPLANAHMKLIRQSEVYLMEEAVTESIIRTANDNLVHYQQKQITTEEDPGIINVDTFLNIAKQQMQSEEVDRREELEVAVEAPQPEIEAAV